MARYAAEGVDVLVATCTGGERGSILNPAMDTPEVNANLSGIRHHEMQRAIEILGVHHTWLGFVDSGLPKGDPLPPLPEGCFGLETLAEPQNHWSGWCGRSGRTSSTTYDENGGTRIRTTSCVTGSASRRSTRRPIRPVLRNRRALAAAQAYYHMTFHRARFMAMHEAMLAAGLDSPYERASGGLG